MSRQRLRAQCVLLMAGLAAAFSLSMTAPTQAQGSRIYSSGEVQNPDSYSRGGVSVYRTDNRYRTSPGSVSEDEDTRYRNRYPRYNSEYARHRDRIQQADPDVDDAQRDRYRFDPDANPNWNRVWNSRRDQIRRIEGTNVRVVGSTWSDYGEVVYDRRYYKPGGDDFVYIYNGLPNTRYRSYEVRPYRYRRYSTYPWYDTYYYDSRWDRRYPTYYAPGFSLGFHYESDDEFYFSYGYGGGIVIGNNDYAYSWYPYGGHQRIHASAQSQTYGHYVGPATVNWE